LDWARTLPSTLPIEFAVAFWLRSAKKRDAREFGDIMLSAGTGNDPRKCTDVVTEGGSAEAGIASP
jgi:hypothetical protein